MLNVVIVAEDSVLHREPLEVLEDTQSVGDLINAAESNISHSSNNILISLYNDHLIPHVLNFERVLLRDDDSVFQGLVDAAGAPQVTVLPPRLTSDC